MASMTSYSQSNSINLRDDFDGVMDTRDSHESSVSSTRPSVLLMATAFEKEAESQNPKSKPPPFTHSRNTSSVTSDALNSRMIRPRRTSLPSTSQLHRDRSRGDWVRKSRLGTRSSDHSSSSALTKASTASFPRTQLKKVRSTTTNTTNSSNTAKATMSKRKSRKTMAEKITTLEMTLQQKEQELEDTKEMLSEQDKSFKKQIAGLQEQRVHDMEKLTLKNSKLKNEQSACKLQIDALKEENKRLQDKDAEIERLRTFSQNMEDKELQLRKEVEDLMTEKLSSQKIHREEKEKMKEEMKALQIEMEKIMEKENGWKMENDRLREQIDSDKSRIKELSEENRMEHHVLKIANQEEMEQKMTEILSELQRMKREEMGHIVKAERLQTQFNKAQTTISKLRQHCDRMQDRYTIKVQELEQWKASMTRIQILNQTEDGENVHSIPILNDHRKHLKFIHDEVVGYKVQVAQMKDMIRQQVKVMNNEFQQSLIDFTVQQSRNGIKINMVEVNQEKVPSSKEILSKSDEINSESETQTTTRSVFAEAVGSLDSLFEEKEYGNWSFSDNVIQTETTESSESEILIHPNLTQTIKNQNVLPIQSQIPYNALPENAGSYNVHSLLTRVSALDRALLEKEEMVDRLNDENQMFREHVRDLQSQLHSEERLNEMNQHQQQMEKLLETLCQQKQPPLSTLSRISTLEGQLTQIMTQNQGLSQSLNRLQGSIDGSVYNETQCVPRINTKAMNLVRNEMNHDANNERDGNESFQTKALAPLHTGRDVIHAVPIGNGKDGSRVQTIMGMLHSDESNEFSQGADRRFSDLFLQQLHSPMERSIDELKLFQKYLNSEDSC